MEKREAKKLHEADAKIRKMVCYLIIIIFYDRKHLANGTRKNIKNKLMNDGEKNWKINRSRQNISFGPFFFPSENLRLVTRVEVMSKWEWIVVQNQKFVIDKLSNTKQKFDLKIICVKFEL